MSIGFRSSHRSGDNGMHRNVYFMYMVCEEENGEAEFGARMNMVMIGCWL